MIRKIKFHQLDFQRYTNCIRSSCQYIFQVEKEYLTLVNGENWDFLVWGNYDAVMPVPFVKKWGIKVVLTPMSIQQLGVFSKEDDLEINHRFHDFLLKYYRVYVYPFNTVNQLNRNLIERKNYILCQQDYETARMNYSVHRRRNVRLHDKRNKDLIFSQEFDLNFFKSFIFEHIIGCETEKIKQKLFDILMKMNEKGFLKIYQITKENKILSLALVVSSQREDYFLNFINNKKIKSNASSLMIDQILQQTIEKKNFSFWGSNVLSVADFYERFGAQLTTYFTIPLSKKRLFKI